MLVTKFSIDKSKRCTTAWLNLRTLHSMQFFTYKVMSENSGLTTRRTAMRVHCEKTSLYTTFWLNRYVRMKMFSQKHVSAYNLTHNFLCCARPTCFHAVCLLRIHARVHTLKDGCLYTFWLTRSCLCVTLNISHLVCHIFSHRCSHNKVQHHKFLIYEPFTLCNFWLTRTSQCANCHIGIRVCVQLTT